MYTRLWSSSVKTFITPGWSSFWPISSSRLEAVVRERVGFHLGMRDLDGDLAAVAQVGGSKNRGHAAAGDQFFNPVVIEQFAGVDGVHGYVERWHTVKMTLRW